LFARHGGEGLDDALVEEMRCGAQLLGEPTPHVGEGRHVCPRRAEGDMSEIVLILGPLSPAKRGGEGV
jgi:hypothetical protein